MDDFEALRKKALEEAPDEGLSILRSSSTMTAFAADTSDYNIDWREDLRAVAENDVQSEAARFIGYEIAEKARRAGVYGMMSDEDSLSVSGELVRGESDLEQFYRAAVLVDRIQRGYTDKRPDGAFEGDNFEEPGRYPNPVEPKTMVDDQMAAAQESGSTDVDNLGSLNMDEIFVVSDDWMRYREGKDPKTVGSNVFEYMREIGAGP